MTTATICSLDSEVSSTISVRVHADTDDRAVSCPFGRGHCNDAVRALLGHFILCSALSFFGPQVICGLRRGPLINEEQRRNATG